MTHHTKSRAHAKKTHSELLQEALAAKTLDTFQAAAYLNLSPNTLNRWRYTGQGPRYRKFGRAIRYQREDLDAWIASTSTSSTTEVDHA